MRVITAVVAAFMVTVGLAACAPREEPRLPLSVLLDQAVLIEPGPLCSGDDCAAVSDERLHRWVRPVVLPILVELDSRPDPQRGDDLVGLRATANMVLDSAKASRLCFEGGGDCTFEVNLERDFLMSFLHWVVKVR